MKLELLLLIVPYLTLFCFSFVSCEHLHLPKQIDCSTAVHQGDRYLSCKCKAGKRHSGYSVGQIEYY